MSNMIENRQTQRSVVDIPGLVRFPNGALSTCWVTDVSKMGARLSFEALGLMPERFELLIGARPACAVRRVWRNGREAGVAFDRLQVEPVEA